MLGLVHTLQQLIRCVLTLIIIYNIINEILFFLISKDNAIDYINFYFFTNKKQFVIIAPTSDKKHSHKCPLICCPDIFYIY